MTYIFNAKYKKTYIIPVGNIDQQETEEYIKRIVEQLKNLPMSSSVNTTDEDATSNKP